MATESLTHKYIPRIEQVEQNIFLEEYYSSTDTRIFINGTEQTEIGYINYSLQEQIKPLYGYASRTFDDVAIGNRIVTGMIKVPINNTNPQSTLEEIEGGLATSTVEDYNDKEDEKMDDVDWITTPDKPPSDTPNTTPVVDEEEKSEYITKLIELGYNLNYNATPETYQRELKKFQKNNNIDANGELTTQTKNLINQKLKEASLPTINLPSGTRVYFGPETTFGYFTITQETIAKIINQTSYKNGWIQIRLEDGREGYINKDYIGGVTAGGGGGGGVSSW